MAKDESPLDVRRSPVKVRDPERTQRMLGFVLWLMLALTLWNIAAR